MWNDMNFWHIMMTFLEAINLIAMWVGEHILPVIIDIAEGITIVLDFIIDLVPTV